MRQAKAGDVLEALVERHGRKVRLDIVSARAAQQLAFVGPGAHVVVRQGPHQHGRRHREGRRRLRPRPQQRDAGHHLVGAAGQRAEHAIGVRQVARLPEHRAVQDHDRVAGDDQGAGIGGGVRP